MMLSPGLESVIRFRKSHCRICDEPIVRSISGASRAIRFAHRPWRAGASGGQDSGGDRRAAASTTLDVHSVDLVRLQEAPTVLLEYAVAHGTPRTDPTGRCGHRAKPARDVHGARQRMPGQAIRGGERLKDVGHAIMRACSDIWSAL